MSTEKRKADHLAICREKPVQFRDKRTGFESIELLHNALPELDLEDIDPSTKFFGKKMDVPVIISAITGGTPEAGKINNDLARSAQKFRIGMGVGSQRMALERPDTAYSFKVRDVAPDILLLGNLGIAQFNKGYGPEHAKQAVKMIDADGLCVHLNAAQEITQPEGETKFAGGLNNLKKLCKLKFPIIVKECGCGISRTIAQQLVKAGVSGIDVGGAGGTSWVGIEYYRSGSRMAQTFWDWGIPTAASVSYCAGLGVPVIATGGVRSGLDAAKAISLGADLVGIALPALIAQQAGAIDDYIENFINELKTAMFLTGCRNIKDLGKAKKIIFEPLRGWLSYKA